MNNDKNTQKIIEIIVLKSNNMTNRCIHRAVKRMSTLTLHYSCKNKTHQCRNSILYVHVEKGYSLKILPGVLN